ncbi:MAG: alpha-2-macroglobulin [Tannerella sp.]|jgi:uncharacterized protein YfaS (alpha-2-macroglobulin family)|nr:alpha-2-macroglobulin [Tannerella sp.]
MKYKNTTIICLIFILLALSCRQGREVVPSSEFAPYISACSGGVLSKSSSITVVLAQTPDAATVDKALKNNLFSFKPALKGVVHFTGNNTFEFTPDEGQLKTNIDYQATFALGKTLKVDKKFSTFVFGFRIEELSFGVTVQPISIPDDNTVTATADIAFSEPVSKENALKMLTATLKGAKQTPEIEGEAMSKNFTYVFKNIVRGAENEQLILAFDAASAGSSIKENYSVKIPAREKFMLVDYNMIDNQDFSLLMTFSDTVATNQNLKSMITPNNISDYTVKAKDNTVTVYFTQKEQMKTIEISVSQALKNKRGETLGKTEDFIVEFKDLKPKVEILPSGFIFPHSQNVTLPFRAAALKAVDVKVIRIFENNILPLLQEYTLRTDDHNMYRLRRAGRLVAKKTLRLDTDPTKDIRKWQTYSLDLSGLVRQQPGAIYRIVLSFRRKYAVYECETNYNERNKPEDAVDIINSDAENEFFNDIDEQYWNNPDGYYSDDYDITSDWGAYDYKQRDNPCHSAYYTNASNIVAAINVYASNLGLLAKTNSTNKVWAAVTNLLTAKSVSGARITAYNAQLQPIGNGTTDENGFLMLNLTTKPFILVAEDGSQKAYLRMADGEANMLSRFDVGGVELKKGLKGFIYGERGVWRPGDSLHLAFILEDRTKQIPDNHPVTLELFTPEGQFYNKQISTSGLNGFYSFDIPTKPDDPTGTWHSYIKIGGATFHKALPIEAIKPNRLKINLSMPDILYSSKNNEQLKLHSQWLTGVTAHDLNAKVEMSLTKVNTRFKGYDEYLFNNPATRFESSVKEVFDGKLDSKGDVNFNLPVPKSETAPGMLQAAFTCRVFEPGGDASIFTRTVSLSPFNSYVGIRFNTNPKEHYLMTDENHLFDIVTLTPEGKPVNRNSLEYKIYRIGWSWWWESGNEVFDSYVNNSSYKPVFQGNIKTVNGKGQIKFRINHPEWGRYFVYVKDTESGHATGGAVLVDWPSWRGRSAKNDPTGIKMLTFTLDKESYNVGDEAVITIPQATAGARALVAIENGTEVLSRTWVTMGENSDTKHTVRITPEMSPNVYVHVSLLQPVSGGSYMSSSNELPIRLYGVIPLLVSNKESKLTPEISVADVLRPETDFEIKVSEKSGKPMTYTLAIVDDGLLDITNFRTPDPWNEFYAREALGIRTFDMFDDVMSAYTGRYGQLFGIGGDQTIDPSKQRANRFKPVVIYSAPVAIGKNETHTHRLKLPSYVGSVRVMVVGGQDGAYGSADKTVTVRSPLMLLSSLPRVISCGEKIALPVNIFAMEANVKDVTVKIETTGKLKCTKSSQSVRFDEIGDKTIFFPIETGFETGVEKVVITASSGSFTSKETVEIDVRNPNPPVIKFENKILEKGQATEFDYTLDGTFDGNKVVFEASRIPTVDLNRRLDFLADYNHFCTEQLTSCAMPLLFLSDLKDLTQDETAKMKKSITEAINSLYGRQLLNGGFVYWTGNGYAGDWVTSYAGTFLTFAREKGYGVSSSVFKKWINYQQSMARNWRQSANTASRYVLHQDDYLQAYRLYSLALAGAPEQGAMNRLKESKDLTLQARWRLAAAYSLCGKHDAANKLIFNASTTVEEYAANNPTYGSAIRDEAMMLETMVLMGKTEDAFRLAQRVSKKLSEERYFSTQSTAYAMLAMGQLSSKMSGKFDFDWLLNGKAQDKVASTKVVYQKTVADGAQNGSALKGKIAVTNGSAGLMYVSVTSKSRPKIDTLGEIHENLRLDVSYTDMSGQKIDPTNISQGSDFYAVIKIHNVSGVNSYTDVALTHIIPSGWEVFNERLIANGNSTTTAADARTKTAYTDIRDDRVMTYFDLPVGTIKEIKVRLQASWKGEFILPAILCEAMYDPSARARTQAGKTTVSGL